MRGGARAVAFAAAALAAGPARARQPDPELDPPGTRLELDVRLGAQPLWTVANGTADSQREWLRALGGSLTVIGVGEDDDLLRPTVRLGGMAGVAPRGGLYAADALAGVTIGAPWIATPSEPAGGAPDGLRLSVAAGAGLSGLSGVVPAGFGLPVEASGSIQLAHFSKEAGLRFELAGRADWIVAGRPGTLDGQARADLVLWYRQGVGSRHRFEIRVGGLARRFAGVTYAGATLTVGYGGSIYFPADTCYPNCGSL